ncbi:MAG: hypothetical protein V4608_03270 [Bacteroidota bacterium]
MIDIVIPLGSGSAWNNNELRYCLRGIEKHLINYRNVFIVGECPDWIQNVTHVKFTEGYHPSKNIMLKILSACKRNNLSNDFLFFNDDFFLIKDIDAPTYPYYHKGNLDRAILRNSGNWYQDYVIETIRELRKKECSTLNFDGHCPIVYNKTAFIDTMAQYDFNQKLTVKSIYCNTNKITGEFMEDCKLSGWKSEGQIKVLTDGRHIFSTGDYCLQDIPQRKSPVKTFIEKNYPNKSKYEK